MNEVQWTRKGPALIVGLVASLWGAGLVGKGKVSAGVVLLLLGAAFVIYSFSIKEWCELHASAWKNNWGELSFNGSLGECIKEKSVLSF